jgi:hypothetical protein
MSVAAEVQRGELAAIEITREPITRTAHLCTLAGAPRTRAALCVQDALVETVRRAVQRPGWRGVRFLRPDETPAVSGSRRKR